MTNHETEMSGRTIEALIAAEQSQALASFRERDFKKAVLKRLAEVSSLRKHRLGLQMVPVVAGFTMVLVFIGGILFLAIPVKQRAQVMARAIERVLLQTPGIIPSDIAPAAPSASELANPSPIEKDFLYVLRTGMDHTRSGQNPEAATESGGPARPCRPLRLEELYKMLFIDKAVERVLELIS